MPRVPLKLRVVALAASMLSVTTALPAFAATRHGLRKADDGATIVRTHWLNGYTFDITVRSPALGTTAPVRIIVPKGWTSTTHRSFPVVYTFHGGRDHYDSWTKNTDIATTARRYNAMVVMPEGGWNGSYTNWFNYGRWGTPQWETFHTTEVRQLVERNYHAGANRAVMGVSSGGEGAMTYAVRHPGLYRFVASYSGVLHLTQPGIPAVLMFLGESSGKYDPYAIWGDPKTDLANWIAHDPYLQAARLRGTGLFVSSGTTGQPGPLDPKNLSPADYLYDRFTTGFTEQTVGSASTSFVQRLKQLGIPATTDLYGDGWHNWAYWSREYKKAWPLIMKAIGGRRVS